MSTNISFENSNKQNDINKETILKEQTSIYCFLEYLFNIEENNSKQIKKRETIFYINDYFRYLSSIFVIISPSFIPLPSAAPPLIIW